MRDIRLIVVVGGALATGAVVGWMLLTLLTSGFHPAEDATEHAAAPEEPFDAGAAPDLCGVVKSVDAVHGRITLSIASEDGKEQEQTYEVAKDAKILLEGPATLDELATGNRVALVFATDGKDVVAIRSEPFRITVKPKEYEVEVGKPFDVVLRVTNASLTPQSFWVMLTTWDMHWRASNPRVTWDRLLSYLNGPTSVKLAPGGVYEQTLHLKITEAGLVSFKMGFTPLADNKMAVLDKRTNRYGEVRMKLNLGERTYWSREVTLKGNDGPEKQ